MRPIWNFDAMHVISDLHLGGFDDRKIFGRTSDLVRLLDFVTSEAAQRRVGVVINGDFVDFLAAHDACYFDPEGAIDKLDRIVRDAVFNPIFTALQRYTAVSGAQLIVNLGNHDLELALPWVREHLVDVLSNGDQAARARIVVETTGEGVLCQVANAQVLCVHGNEADIWNVTDHEALRRIGRDIQHGQPATPWIPNAGTKLVIEIMNEIKRTYPFVDLLKPETDGVIPALLVLDPSLVSRVPAAVPVGGRWVIDRVKRALDLLSADAGSVGVMTSPPATVRPMRQERLHARRRNDARRLLDAAEQRFSAGDAPIDLLGDDDAESQLGLTTAMVKRALTGDVAEALREAMQPLSKDRSFNLFEPDDTFTEIDGDIAGSVDVVVTGHTHLERVLPRRAGRGIYFNTGTWARVIQVTPADLESAATFQRFYNAFTAGTMKALDDSGVAVTRPAFLSVWSDGGAARAELRHVLPPARGALFEPAAPNGRAFYSKG